MVNYSYNSLVTELKIVVRIVHPKTESQRLCAKRIDQGWKKSSSSIRVARFLFRARHRKPSLGLWLDDSMNQETQRPRGCWCSRSHTGRRVAVRGVRDRVSGGSRIDTLNGTSETAMDSRVGSGNTYLVPSRSTIDTHGFADITVARLEDTIVIVSRHVPVALDERYQGTSKSEQ